MDIFSVFTLLGGLAFFLYGMNVLSGSLEKMVGGKLESVLKSMTSSRWKGLLLGAVITIAIQSSSAMTVMLVGLVNSGIMELSQTVSVIMGSSMGTTLTAWILSATGIQSDSVWLQMLKPESFSPIVALVGVVMIMTGKDGKKKDAGQILVGFAILMTGMTFMSSSVSPLAETSAFQELLVMFRNPLMGVLIGTVFTGIIQSSAASVGILQSLAMTGSISMSMAFPIITGANIGTCVTGLLSAIGANKNAKRVVAVSIYFKVIGTIICLSVFYGLNALFRFDVVDAPISAFGIAVVHTLFNIVNTFVLLPFSKQLERLAKLTIRDSNAQEALLDERLMLSPAFAISECRALAVKMARAARDSMLEAIQITREYDPDIAEEINQREEEIDLYEDTLGSFLVKLSSKDLSPGDSSEAAELLHAIGDFERIGDHAINIMEVAQEINDKSLRFSDKAQTELEIITQAIVEILSLTVDAFEREDATLAAQVEPLEQVVDELKQELKNRHIRRLQEGRCTIELGFVLTDLLTNYERVSDHCSNVAITVLQVKENTTIESHGYMNELKNSGRPEFTQACQEYAEKYRLPASKSSISQ